MPNNALILHGTNGHPQENWFPWLDNELTARGWKVWVPQLPNAESPNAKKYLEYIFSSDWKFDGDSVLIGHSSGSLAALHVLQHLPDTVTVAHVVLVGAFKDDLGWDNLKGLFETPLEYKKIQTKARKFTLIHSDNDPYCPLEHAEFLTQQLGGKLIVQPGQQHFSINKGGEQYRQFPLILEVLGV